MQQAPETLNLRQAVGVLRRRSPWIVLCVALFTLGAYGFSKQQTKEYTATASLLFANNPLSQQIAGLSPAATSPAALLAQQDSNLERVRRGDMAASTAALLGHGLSQEKVASSLTVSAQGESGVVEVSATAAGPRLAAAIANAYARQVVKEQQAVNARYFRTALALVHRQLAGLSRAQRFGADGVQLQNRAQTLELLSELQYGGVQLAEEAVVPASPSSPRTARSVLLGALLGLLVGLGIAFTFEHFDRRVRDPQELQSIYRRPLLGAVPRSAALATPRGDPLIPPRAVAEAFSLIRAHLRSFNTGRHLHTVLIGSAAPGEGKSTVALGLAHAAARSGSRVLLIEADLREPCIARRLALPDGPGLAEVLSETVSAEQATHSLRLPACAGEERAEGTLEVIAAGGELPANPGALLESPQIDALLERARFAYDLVLIDPPALTAVSDAFPLLGKVDGILLVGWVGRSRRDPAERLHQVLAASGAPVSGVIANGARSPSAGPYDSGVPGLAPGALASSNGAGMHEQLISPTGA